MDGRRVGGGILTSVGVFAPSIAGMLGLKVDQWIGYPLLVACAVAAIVGVTLLYWSKRETPEKPQTALARIEGSVIGGSMDLEGNGYEVGLHVTGTGKVDKTETVVKATK